MGRTLQHTREEDTYLNRLKGSWEGVAKIASAKCVNASGTVFLCCVDDLSEPISVGVELGFVRTDLGAKLEFKYTTAISTMLSNGMFVFQPTFAWATEILELKGVEGAMRARTALSIDTSYCLYVYEGRSVDEIIVAVRARSKLMLGHWTQDYWCEEPPETPSVGGCMPKAVCPNLSDSFEEHAFTSWWHTSTMALSRHPLDSAATNASSNSSGNSFGTTMSKESAQEQRQLTPSVIVLVAAATVILVIALLFIVWRGRKQLPRGRKPEPAAVNVNIEAEKSGQTASSRVDLEANESASHIDTQTWGPIDVVNSGIREHWLIQAEDIVLEDAISGSGAFGDVRKGVLLDATTVAVKTCHPDADLTSAVTALSNEMRLLRRVRHPNIVMFLGVHGNFSLVLEWVEGMNLKEYVLNAISQCIPCEPNDLEALPASAPRQDPLARSARPVLHEPKLLLDVSSGMQFLHAQRPPILHRDLKPANVLVETVATPPRAKITDFGLSVLLQGIDVKTRAGTKHYMAPEVLAGLPYNASADIFSFGCTTCFALTGKRPIQRAVQEATKSAMVSAAVPDETLMVVVACLQEAPDTRPNFTEVRNALKTWTTTLEAGGRLSTSTSEVSAGPHSRSVNRTSISL